MLQTKGAMMQKHDDYKMLMRIIALLFSLANLTERLVDASPLARRFVLWLLRRAEAIAREWVAGEVSGHTLRNLPPAAPLDADGPRDAMRLASCFRGLALALGAALAQFSGAGGFRMRGKLRVFATPPAGAAPVCFRSGRYARHLMIG
jgi:hypothetical protein